MQMAILVFVRQITDVETLRDDPDLERRQEVQK
jgi:hypothetical protein